jgi:triphosphoribosyl-dephospho-CoA synthase
MDSPLTPDLQSLRERLLDARVARAALVGELLQQACALGARATVLVSVNAAGPDKSFPGLASLLEWASATLTGGLPGVGDLVQGADPLGPYAAFLTSGEPTDVKLAAIELEESQPAGRLLDIDVYGADGQLVDRASLGRGPRKCLVCAEPAVDCMRLQRHDAATLVEAARDLLASLPHRTHGHGFEPRILARHLCSGAMSELRLTPKPGLVDRLDNGSHPDLTFEAMATSVNLLPIYFEDLIALHRAGQGLDVCIQAGRRAEDRMFRAIGANAHRGFIFLGGLVLLAACESRDGLREAATRIATEFFAGRQTRRQRTAGSGSSPRGPMDRASGIEAETLAGLPSVFDVGLPAFSRRLDATGDFVLAAHDLMARLMRHADDTTALRRSGPAGLRRLRRDGARLQRAIETGVDYLPLVKRWNEEYRKIGLTMGGVADLMAVTFALFFTLRPRHPVTLAQTAAPTA